MDITPDTQIVFVFSGGPFGPMAVSATIVNTWIVMAILVVGGRLATLGIGPATPSSRRRIGVEYLVELIRGQIRAIGGGDPGRGPWILSPTGSLSTATALALCVLVAVPIYGIAENGLRGYQRHYITPTPFMAPFNIIGEISRTIALAVRLYGNVMSGTVVAAMLLPVMPFFFPVLMQLLGLLTGVIQAYVIALLAMV